MMIAYNKRNKPELIGCDKHFSGLDELRFEIWVIQGKFSVLLKSALVSHVNPSAQLIL